ncbi:unnamed protein product [Colias eurytheme]|nr:unnamed protein product [Colias eurytheme]
MSPNPTCAACMTPVTDDNRVTCSNKNCKKIFHILCIGNCTVGDESDTQWICPECQVLGKKGGDNSTTPARSNAVTENSRKRKKVEHLNSPQTQASIETSNYSSDVQVLTEEIRLLRETVLTFKSDMASLVSSLALCEKNLEDIKAVHSSKIQELEAKQRENVELKSTINSLRQELDFRSQAFLINELEVIGIEEESSENPIHLAMTTANKIGVNITENDLDSVTRAGPRHHRKDSNSDSNYPAQPRPLIIRFTRKIVRDLFLKAGRSRRTLHSKDIVGHGPERKVYVNERLTREKRQLFRDTRRAASDANFKYCWIKNGSIYIRKRTGSPAIKIQSSDDLLRMPFHSAN